ncbi:MAG: ADP-ribosylglycohydrolase family protein [Dehalococcoidia bacterium]|nr:ADP-ribosylglycohydrolase family protein [Dehalococcoidia bacterium]
MHKLRLKPKFSGCLVGAAIGDGLGSWQEGKGMTESEKVEPLVEKLRQLIYTDDTHMTIGVTESLIASKGFNGEHMAQTFLSNYEAEPWRGYGPGPPQIFRMIETGEPWNSAARKLYNGGSMGNGSAMRVAPVGLLYSSDPAKLREIAYQSSSITHSHELGREGAALQAYAVALALNTSSGEELNQKDYLLRLQDFAQNRLYKEKVARIKELLGEQDKARVVTVLGNGIEALRSVPTAIYSFLRQPGAYKDTVIYAISLGGDTDTIASMAGAISGAYLGIDAIPGEWKAKLENKDYIEALAERLWRLTAFPYEY